MNEQSTTKKYIAMRMERQHLLTPANETEYDALYRKPFITERGDHRRRKDLWGRSRKIRRPCS